MEGFSVCGDVRRYWAGCRCIECRRANAAYAKQRKLNNPRQVRKEQRAYWGKNKNRLNAQRRLSKERIAQVAASNVKRRHTLAGALIDEVVDQPPRSRYLVYALVDPTDLRTRYVGVSSSGLQRPKVHGSPSYLAKAYNKRKDDWIVNLKSRRLYYAIRVLEYFDTPEEAHAAEPYWINWFRSIGEHLYNLTVGDDTQIRASEETKLKMRQRMLGRVITWGDKISSTKRAKNK